MREPELVTVIVPVYNGKDLIAEELDALAGQDYGGRFEVLVSDNGSTDGTIEFVESYAAGSGLDLRVVDASAERGVCYARDAGVASAKGEIVMFCDHDDWAHPDFVRRLVETMVATGADIVTAAVEDTTLNPPGLRRFTKVPDPEHLQPVGLKSPSVAGGAFACRTDVYQAVGGMDGTWESNDDIEFGFRAASKGYRIEYLPEALLAYRYRTDMRSAFRQSYTRGTSMVRLHKVYPDSGLPEIRLSELVITPIELLIYFPRFSRSEWAFLAGFWWGKVRGKLRYRNLTPYRPSP